MYLQVYEEVSDLFAEHTDLLDEFKNFLPDRSQGPQGTIDM